MEIWCNEAQERYVLALQPGSVPKFAALCARERCPFAVVGEITAEQRLLVSDSQLGDAPVDMPLDVLLGKTPRMTRKVRSVAKQSAPLPTAAAGIAESLDRLLCLPTIADKSFLITIGDRSVGGMISRDQMVGPWQVPVADVAVTLNSFDGYGGEAMSMGERSPIALLDAPASGRMAVGEAITNMLAADVHRLTDIRLSANWMAACGEPGEDADLYATVRAVRRGTVRLAGHNDSRGQGFLVHANRLARRQGRSRRARASVADHLGVRPAERCARHADPAVGSRAALAPAAHRLRVRQKSPRRFVLGPGLQTRAAVSLRIWTALRCSKACLTRCAN